MNIERIPLEQIDASNRLRPVDPDQVLLIASSIAEVGIRTPIEVRPGKTKGSYLLVTGGHRYAAAQMLELPDAPAIVLPKMSDDEARMHEIRENVYRHDLSDLDRAVFLSEMKTIHERLHPHTQHGKGRASELADEQVAIFGHLAERFTAEVQERLGYSERTIRRIVKRASIAPEVRAMLAGTQFARNGSELDALVKLEPDQQREAARMVLGGAPDSPRSLAQASALVVGRRAPERSDEDIQFAALMKAWKASGARARRRFVDTLVDDGDPHILGAAPRLHEAA